MFLWEQVIVFFYPLGIIIGKVAFPSVAVFRLFFRQLIDLIGISMLGQKFKVMMNKQYKSSFLLIGEKGYLIVKSEQYYFETTIHIM